MDLNEFCYGLLRLAQLFTSENPELQEKLALLFNFALDLGPQSEPAIVQDILRRARELKEEYGEKIEDYNLGGGPC